VYAAVYIPPERRNVGYVFQSYALYPHMTAFDNIAFPLKMANPVRGVDRLGGDAGDPGGGSVGGEDRRRQASAHGLQIMIRPVTSPLEVNQALSLGITRVVTLSRELIVKKTEARQKH
jgi:ABC-type sugar transport system ATPase subunit